MIPVILSLFAAASLGPIGNDAVHTPQVATNGLTVGLAFGAGNAIYYSDGGSTSVSELLRITLIHAR